MKVVIRQYALTARIDRLLRPRGKVSFISMVKPAGRVLDVGCGNDSPLLFKRMRPDLHYTGLDIEDYNQSIPPSSIADRYITTTPERFAEEIRRLRGQFDAILSSHNVEHCNEPEAVLDAMVSALAADGMLFLSFPCAASVHFPSRPRGCLNFYDDPTHGTPPDFQRICSFLGTRNMRIQYAAVRYRPPVPAALGLILEPLAALQKRVMPAGSTWALYGFESIIWAAAANSPAESGMSR
jgi:SAM-dependent methyltransferase